MNDDRYLSLNQDINKFFCIRLNSRSLIQLSEILSVKLTETHPKRLLIHKENKNSIEIVRTSHSQ